MVSDHGFARVGTMQVQAIMPLMVSDRILTKEFWGWGWGSEFDPECLGTPQAGMTEHFL